MFITIDETLELRDLVASYTTIATEYKPGVPTLETDYHISIADMQRVTDLVDSYLLALSVLEENFEALNYRGKLIVQCAIMAEKDKEDGSV